MALTFSVEPFRKIWSDIDRIGRQHWVETEWYHSGQHYNPDWDRYFAVDDAGWFFVATARYGGRVVGYVGCYCMPSMHSQSMIAMEDFFFLEEAHRKGWNAIRFLRFVENECRIRGCVEIGFTDKKGKGLILERTGYKVVAKQYCKSIGADSPTAKRTAVEAQNLLPVSPPAA